MLFWEPIIWDVSAILTEYTEYNNYIYVLYLGYILCFFGFCGICFRRGSILYVLLGVELMLLGINLVFVCISIIFGLPQAQLIVLMVLINAAGETVVGLAFIYIYHQIFASTDVEILKKLNF